MFALHALLKNKVFEGSTNQTMSKTYIIKARGVLPYMGYIGTCRGIGYGF